MAVVLVADDEVLIRMVIVTIIEDAGHTTLQTHCPHEAKELAANADFAFLDMNFMSDIDGCHIGEAINIPFSYVTGNTDEESVTRMKATLPISIIEKPFRDLQIIAALEALLDKAA